MTSPVLIDHLARQPASPRSQIVRIAAGSGLELAIKVTRDGQAVLLVTDKSPVDAATRFREITRAVALQVFVADMLGIDTASAEAAAADIGIALDQTSAAVLIIDPASVLPIEDRALTFALRHMASTRDLAIVLAGTKR